MHLFPLTAILSIALACDSIDEPTQLREAPDVPWPSVEIAGQVKTPRLVGELLVECFKGELVYPFDYGAPTQVHYQDKTPDGDDQQPAQLCVSWQTHLDAGDCVRLALLELGAKVLKSSP